MTRYGIVIPVRGKLEYTVQCLESVVDSAKLNTGGIQVIVVDNGPGEETATSGYVESLREEIRRRNIADNIDVCWRAGYGRSEQQPPGWCRGINQGFAELFEKDPPEFMVMLNNDTVVHGDWLDRLAGTFGSYANASGDIYARVGLAGPVTNSCGGPQRLNNTEPWNVRRLPQYYRECAHANADAMEETGMLVGFCMMVSAACYRDVLKKQFALTGTATFLDERFEFGGFDDNDVVLMAQDAGYRAILNPSVFVWHYGSVSIMEYCPDMMDGLPMRVEFIKKWQAIKRKRTRLLAMIRTKNGSIKGRLHECLDNIMQFADGAVVISDGSTDNTVDVCTAHPTVLEIRHYDNREFNECRDRNELLDMAEDHGADWVIAVDDDEIYELTRERALKLMTLANPHAKSICVKWYTFWDGTHYRDDGIFGEMTGWRMCKLEPHRRIYRGNALGLHCGNIPQYAGWNAVISDVRVRHYGYDDPVKRAGKFEFYENIDSDKQVALIGSTGYDHVKAERVLLQPWRTEDGVSLNVIGRNEGRRLAAFLEFWEPYVDEIIFVDTGSEDNTVEIAGMFTDRVIRLKPAVTDLGSFRNVALEHSSFPWILAMDPDEEMDGAALWKLRRAMNRHDIDAYFFNFITHHPGGRKSTSQSIRLFQRAAGLRWSRPVHETVEQSINHGRHVTSLLDLDVHHYGFMLSIPEVQRKIDFYRQLGLQYMKKYPADPQPYYNEAMYWWNLGELDRCNQWLDKAVNKAHGRFYQAHLQKAQVYQMKALTCLHHARKAVHENNPAAAQIQTLIEGLRRCTPPPILIGDGETRRQQYLKEEEEALDDA